MSDETSPKTTPAFEAAIHSGLYYDSEMEVHYSVNNEEVNAADFAVHYQEVRKALGWVAQTVHQAYHSGPIEQCPRGTCDHAMRVLGRKPL